MKQLQLEVQAREKQIMKGYEEPLAAARQQNAEAVVSSRCLGVVHASANCCLGRMLRLGFYATLGLVFGVYC